MSDSCANLEDFEQLAPAELVDDAELVTTLRAVQGIAGPPGGALAPPRPIASDATTPVETIGTLCWSTLDRALLIFIDPNDGLGLRWYAVGAAAVDPTVLTDDAGNPLTTDAGEVIRSG